MRVAWLFALLLAIACSPEPAGSPDAPPAPPGPLRVVAVNAPLASFAREIGGAAVEVDFPVPAGVDPAFWSPDPETVAGVQQADLVLRNGARYAGWIDRASLRRGRLVDTSEAFHDALLPIEAAVVHQHGPEGEHSHGEVAFTVWLDLQLAQLQARAVAQAFTAVRPAEAEAFAARLAKLAARLEALDSRLASASKRLADAPLLLSHPVYQYPTARYGWNARALHWEPDALPSDDEWRAVDALLEIHAARWMLWEAAPTAETRRRLSARGVTPVVFSPGANIPADESWLDRMEENVAAFESIAGGKARKRNVP
jgi:zinc transport system substrate-binding protein